MNKVRLSLQTSALILLLSGLIFFAGELGSASSEDVEVSPHHPPVVRIQAPRAESPLLNQVPDDQTGTVGVATPSGVEDAAAEAPGRPAVIDKRGDIVEGGNDPHVLYGTDVLVRTGRVPSFGDLSLDHAEDNDELYTALLVPGPGVDDTVEIHKSTDNGATWNIWGYNVGAAASGGIKDAELIVGPGANPWIYSFSLYEAAGANGGLWVRRMRADSSAFNWVQIIAGGDTLSDISADRSTGGSYHLFVAYLAHSGATDRVRAEASADEGMTWINQRNVSSGDRPTVRIAAGGDNYVYITYPVDTTLIRIGRYEDNLNGATSFNDVNTEGEGDWRPWVAGARTTPGTSQSAWVLYRHRHSTGNIDLHLAYSTNGGASWTQTAWAPTNYNTAGLNLDYTCLRVPYNYTVDFCGASAVIYDENSLIPDTLVSAWALASDVNNWQGRIEINDWDATTEFGPRIDVTNGMGGRGIIYRRYASDEVYFDWANNLTGVEEGVPGSAPQNFTLAHSRPNPFHNTTIISLMLPKSLDTDLSVYDLTGRRITTLTSGRLEAGRYSFTWDGRDNSGREVSSGVYFYRLTAGEYTSTKKLVLLR